jgi:hypothetical protein
MTDTADVVEADPERWTTLAVIFHCGDKEK